MERKHKIRWGVTAAAVILLLITASNVFAIREIMGLRRELNETTAQLAEQVSGIQDGFQDSLERAKEDLRGSIEQEDSMLAEFEIEVGRYNSVAGTVHVTFRATPKEYHEGVNLFFMYTCDEQDSVTVTGERDDNGVFQKEVDIPLCEIMNVKVVISDGGSVKTETKAEAFEIKNKVYLPLSVAHGGSPILSNYGWGLAGKGIIN